MTIKFKREKETINKVRFQEVVDEGTAEKAGYFYLDKSIAGSSPSLTLDVTLDEAPAQAAA